jgi:peptidoglycan/LPS O-acetylase OafA/YrhL
LAIASGGISPTPIADPLLQDLTHKPASPPITHATAAAAVRPRLHGIEAGRGLAAATVVLYHAARHLDKAYGASAAMAVFKFGHAGVDFFFVISGFIILFVHHNDIGRPERLRHYLGRRAIRLLPVYWIALAGAVLLTTLGTHHLPAPTALINSVLLLPVTQKPLLEIGWTLQHEIVFYAIFSVMILHRTAGIALFGLWASIIATTVWIGHPLFGLPPAISSAFGGEFFIGMAVAGIMIHTQPRHAVALLLLGAALFAAVAAAEDAGFINGYKDLARLLYGVPSALLVVGAAEWSRTMRGKVPAWLAAMGAASYSIYLFQFMFIGLIWRVWQVAGLDRTGHLKLCFPVLVASAIAGGIVVSRTLEYPLMRRLRRAQGT